MTAPRRVPNARNAPRAASGALVLTTAGAAEETAREAAFLARRIAGSGSQCPEFAPAHLAAFLRRCARNLEACARELRDPISHRPCCAEAERLVRENQHLRRRADGLASLLDGDPSQTTLDVVDIRPGRP
jgi:hypothetical protein